MGADFETRRPDVANVQPIRWAYERRIPLGALSLLVGEEGAGKGTFLAWMTARLTRGELPGDLHEQPVNVLIVGDEDSFDDVWTPRLLAAGADLEHVRELPASDTLGLLDVKRDLGELRRIVRDDDVRVVVFDQLLDNLPATTDEWKPRSVRGALRPLGRLAREEGVAMLGTLHTNKGAVGSFREKMSGSHAFSALARSGLLLAQHPDDRERRVLTRGKGNLSVRPPAVEFAIESKVIGVNGHLLNMPLAASFKESELTIEQVLGGADATDESYALKEAADFLEAVLADGPLTSKELGERAEEAGITWATLKRARKQVGVQSFQRNRQWLTRLPHEPLSQSEPLRAPENVDPVASSQRFTGAQGFMGSTHELLNVDRAEEQAA